MSLKKFLFWITEKDGRTRQIVNNVVTSLNNPKPLPNAPDGSQELNIGWERSETYKGNIRNFSLAMGFVTDGYKILANDFIKFNLDRELYLLVKRLTYEFTPITFKEYYKQLYKGQFDFATAELDKGNFRFNINLMEGGLHRLLKANESTQYELPFDLDSKNVRMDGMFIEGTYRWVLPESGSVGIAFVGMYQLSNDDVVPGLGVFDVQEEQAPGTPFDESSTQYFATATQDIAGVVISGTIVNLNATGGDPVLNMRLGVYNVISDAIRLDIDLTPDDPYPQNSNVIVNETIDLLRGDRIFMTRTTKFFESNLQLYAKSKPLPSVIPGFNLYDVGRKLTEKITGNADDFDSTLLADLISDFGCEIILTSGDGVRGITNASLKTSWKDFYKFCDVMLMTRMNITDKIRIENRITAYQPPSVTPAISLGTVKDLKVTPAIDQMYTSIKVGHQEQDVNDTNGKFDFNGFMIFTTPIKSIPDKQMDLQNPYKASPYEIEQTRANYEGKTTTDKDTDNDVFALAVTPDATTMFTSTSVFDPTGGLFYTDNLLSLVAAIPVLRPGMKIRVTGATNPDNNKDYTIKNQASWFFGQLIQTNETMTAESGAVITVEILEGQYYDLDRSIAIDQLTDPDVSTEIKESVFNVRLSPKRILLRHATWLAGMCYGYESEKLTFSSANRNKEMIADGLIEKADIQISTLGTPMFIPKYFEFEITSPVDMVEILDANPNPVFDFDESEGFNYNGFFYRGGIALNDLEEETFKLLATFENDMENLIP